jgi:hypothetical protein
VTLSQNKTGCQCAECHYAECRYAGCHYAECRYAECHYAECRYAECHYAECRGAIFKWYFFSKETCPNYSNNCNQGILPT